MNTAPFESEPLVVSKEEEGLRLDRFLVLRFEKQSLETLSRTYFQYLIEEGLVLLNGQPSKKRVLVKEGDEIEVEFALTPEISLSPEPIPLNIIYEDDDLLAVNKPAGMVVHPAPGHWNSTFVNALLYHCKQLPNQGLRPGIVHRLDKDTTGLLIAAKNEEAQRRLVAAFAAKEIEKEYIAICIGKAQECQIETKIGRHPFKRQEMAVLDLEDGRGKKATTICKLVDYNQLFSVVKLYPQTGRTHQLRVHLKYLKTPILGDNLYGNPTINKKWGVERQLLHAYRLKMHHPMTKKTLELIADLPQDMETWIQRIKH